MYKVYKHCVHLHGCSRSTHVTVHAECHNINSVWMECMHVCLHLYGGPIIITLFKSKMYAYNF